MIKGLTHITDWIYVIALTLGLACLNVWPDVVGHGIAFDPAASVVAPITNGRVFFSSGMAVCTFLFAVQPRRLSHLDPLLHLLIPLISVAATLIFAATGSSLNPIAGMSAAALIGFGYGWYLVQLISQLSRLSNQGTAVTVAVASLLLKTLLDDICGLTASTFQIIIAAAMPLAMSVALRLTERENTDARQVVDLVELPKISDHSRTIPIALLIVNAVLHAVTRALSNLGLWGGSNVLEGGVTWSFALVALILTVMVALTMSHLESGNMLTRFLPAFLLLLGGYFVLDPQTTELVSMPSWLVISLTQALELFAHTLYWMIIVAGVRRLAMPPYRVIGMTVATMDLTAMVLAVFVQNFTGMNHMVVMTAMYLFVFVIIMLFRNSLSENSDAPTNVAAPSALQMRCKTMAEEAHLTPREIEVFMLLAQGRDRSYIQSELYISEATVKTHSQHIYAKLGVHNKQELISLVQQRED